MYKKINFYNKNEQRLSGILHYPKEESDSAIVMIHGLGGNKDERGLFVQIAKELEKNHYVLRFDCAGSGESQGKTRDVTRKTEKYDLLSAIDYVHDMGLNKVGIIGFSLGAGVSIISYNSDFKTLCLMSSSTNPKFLFERYKKDKNYMKELKQKGYFIKKRDWGTFEIGKKFVDESRTLKLEPYIQKIKCPTLVVHGEEDSISSLDDSKRLYKLLKEPKKLEIVKGSEHNYESHEKEVSKIISKWFNKYLV